MGKKIMIVGANFEDKGAQAKVYIIIDELKKRFGDCEVFYAHNDSQFDDALYRFNKIVLNRKVQSQVLKSNPLGNITKLFRKKDDSASSGNDIVEMISQMDLIIDASDHALVDTASIEDIEYYLDNIRIAKKFKIPMIVMPQSFGPFNFGLDSMHVLGEMKDLLFYPKKIYAREQDGYNEMIGYFGLDNLDRSNDIILPSNNFDLSNVCTRFYRAEIPEITEGNNVAIIPNARCFSKNFNDRTMDMYKKLFETLKDAKKNVYIFSQASSDMEVCKTLFSTFRYFSNVNMIEKELDCFELNQFMKNFEIVISSRYLGCVQAYRNFIPVLLLGNGAKYKELAELLGQESLFFDVLSDECNKYDVDDALIELIKDTDIAKTRVQTRMLTYQNQTIFDIFDKLGW
ncbi:MAG: polysaccharide pyruvyl transferase family protein [Eubacterium sp.]|nr:polysaccharide pyruvyl transferase family protein [Eubacterium sp.]